MVAAPILYGIRKNEKENAELRLTLSDFRIETAKMYVTKKDLAEDVDRILQQQTSIIDSINRLDAKVDSLLLDK